MVNSMSPEVLIYIQNIKKYFTENASAQQYFNVKGNEDTFFEYVSEISQKNFEDNGEPQLSLNQFEELRNKIGGSSAKLQEATGYFVSYGHFGYISLN
jgi:hypothetical protein